MEAILTVIVGKKRDYKICRKCGSVNWYEREVCHSCCESRVFKPVSQKWIDSEYDFWQNVEGYSEAEADNVLYDC